MTILIIDDEPQIRQVLRVMFQAQGYQTVEAANGADGLVATFTTNPDCIVLDIGLPDLSGIEVLQSIRRHSEVAVIMLTIHDDEQEKVRALDGGADDYITKPFGARELMARVRVALRHRISAAPPSIVKVGALAMDFERHLVERDGISLHLTPIEYDLLHALATNLGRVLTQSHLLKQVWGEATGSEDVHYLRIYIGHLRKKIEEDPTQPQVILTEPGVGYRMVEPEEPATEG
jgi:two-component system KDP operon response regulator KdpE